MNSPTRSPSPDGTPAIDIAHIQLALGEGRARVHILKDISLRVASGEAVGLIGPSGSGKSTLLMVMAGLERPDSGEVVVDGTAFNALDEDGLARFRGRHVGIVFQSFHLIPTMTALENVAVPLELAGRADAFGRAAAELAGVGLGGRLHHYPAQLSGGEQQRVALARALAANPQLVLFDEPLSNLDARLRDSMRLVIRDLAHKLKFTAIYVTHDRLEAMVMSDRIVILNKGRIVQEGKPQSVYRRPNSLFAARVLGDANVLDGTVTALDGGRATVALANGLLMAGVVSGASVCVGDRVDLVVRPTSLQFSTATGAAPQNSLRGEIEDEIFLGETWRYRIRLAQGQQIEAVVVQRVAQRGVVEVSIATDAVAVLPGAAKEGQ